MTRTSGLLLGLVVLVAACSGSGTGPGANSGAPGSSLGLGQASAPASGAPGGGPVASPGSACDLLTDADIQAATGLGVASKAPKFMSGVSENGCDWTLNDAGGSDVQLAYVANDGRHFFDTYYAPYNSPLPGIGDAAITTDAGAVMAVRGDAVVLVDYIEFPISHPTAARQLGQAALGHLP